MSNISPTHKESTFWERYRLLFNRRGEDGWSVLFGYPIARLLVVLIVPVLWITPSRLTLLGFAIKLACVAAILPQAEMPMWSVVVLLQLAQILDSMDGTLARARPAFSKLGAFLDKITDAIGFYGICVAVGIRATAQTGEWHFIVLGGVAGACFLQLCYMYWVVKGATPAENSSASMAGGADPLPWSELFREWLGGFLKLRSFGEADVYLWISVFAISSRYDLCVYLLVVTQGLTMLKRTVDHLKTLSAMDRQI
ncbi:MAG: CDP-alcohol phosphatidyltransferase family protein [Kofleriaceae bacterium]|nr:CDP-alcohol phosphatidyltransferase family protein [Kofleriaceae bacterium]